jgi:hypothetical protein
VDDLSGEQQTVKVESRHSSVAGGRNT